MGLEETIFGRPRHYALDPNCKGFFLELFWKYIENGIKFALVILQNFIKNTKMIVESGSFDI